MVQNNITYNAFSMMKWLQSVEIYIGQYEKRSLSEHF